MATTSRASTRTSLQLPRPIEPIKPLASEPRGPQTANLPLPAPTLYLFARAACSKQRRPPQPNLHSPNSRPAVQCNEGFCNAHDGQRLTLTTSTTSQKPHNYANRLSAAEGEFAIFDLYSLDGKYTNSVQATATAFLHHVFGLFAALIRNKRQHRRRPSLLARSASSSLGWAKKRIRWIARRRKNILLTLCRSDESHLAGASPRQGWPPRSAKLQVV